MKLPIFTLLMFLLTLTATAQEQADTSDDAFDSGFGSFDSDLGMPAADQSATEGGNDGSSVLAINGSANLDLRYQPLNGYETESIDDLPLENAVSGSVDLSYTGSSTEYFLGLDFDAQDIGADGLSAVDECYMKLFSGRFLLQLGKMKTTWGKGDTLHVLDVLNGTDYSDFINGSSEDRKIPALMIKLDTAVGDNGNLECAYLPMRVSDRIPYSGQWTPRQISTALSSARQTLLWGPDGDNGLYAAAYAAIYGGLYTSAYNQAYAQAIAAGLPAGQADAAAIAAATDSSIQDTASRMAMEQAQDSAGGMIDALLNPDPEYKLSDAQLGVRYTDTFMALDYGAQYYWGFEKTPVLPDLSAVQDLSSFESVTFEYPRIHIFGLDCAFALGSFNMRAETAYTLQNDSDYSDSFSYTAGFDVSVPLHNVGLNVQSQGTYYIDDVPDRYRNRVAVQVSDTWNYEKIKPELKCVYNIENRDVYVRGELTWVLSDEMELTAGYSFFEGDEDTDFGQFRDMDFLEMEFTYRF